MWYGGFLMRHWFTIFLLITTTSAGTARSAPRSKAKPKALAYWYQIVPRWGDQSDQEWLYLAQPAKGKLQGAFVWPKRDDNGRPILKFLRLEGTMESGRVWLNSPNEMRYQGVFSPTQFAAGRLTLIYQEDASRIDWRRATPPRWKGVVWVDILHP